MRVYIKNKLFSLKGSSSVKDVNGNNVFYVKGKLISPTHKKFVCDKSGKKLYIVRNKWINFINERAIVYDKDREKIASVKHPFLSGKKFVIEGYEDDILIDGEFFSMESTILRNGRPVGRIIRQFNLVTDSFMLEAEEEDMPFMIALVIAIDNIVDKAFR